MYKHALKYTLVCLVLANSLTKQADAQDMSVLAENTKIQPVSYTHLTLPTIYSV